MLVIICFAYSYISILILSQNEYQFIVCVISMWKLITFCHLVILIAIWYLKDVCHGTKVRLKVMKKCWLVKTNEMEKEVTYGWLAQKVNVV